MSRVDSVKVAAMKAVLPLKDFVVASAPSSHSPTAWNKPHTRDPAATIQPGGSVRDEDVIAAADRLGLDGVYRQFRH